MRLIMAISFSRDGGVARHPESVRGADAPLADYITVSGPAKSTAKVSRF